CHGAHRLHVEFGFACALDHQTIGADDRRQGYALDRCEALQHCVQIGHSLSTLPAMCIRLPTVRSAPPVVPNVSAGTPIAPAICCRRGTSSGATDTRNLDCASPNRTAAGSMELHASGTAVSAPSPS